MSGSSDIGIAGLGAMGGNLALQALEKGLRVAVHDPWPEARAGWAARGIDPPAEADAAAFAACLEQPRRILLLLKAGAPTDAFLDVLLPHLAPGDIVADLGNAHHRDTEARQNRLAAQGIHLLGIGISGGAEGARSGASFMVGGERAAWEQIAPMLELLAAHADGAACSGWFGPGAAGHFVKMVHNGIEYAEMQALAEAYMALRDGNGLDAAEIAACFKTWNQGAGQSFLTGLAADVLRTVDQDGRLLIDQLLDEVGQKGTGRWTIEAALELGVAAPTLAEAVFARALSAQIRGRRAASHILALPERRAVDPAALGQALLGTRICALAQGFAILAAASEVSGWSTDLAAVAEVWRAGCILRGALLPEIAAAWRAAERPADLVAAPLLAERLRGARPLWQDALNQCQSAGIPVPVMASALAYHDGWASPRLGANLIAAQRDAFGAHGFRRLHQDGLFHARWDSEGPAEP